MKKEDLIAMGLTEEQAKQVMAEHGKTVTTLNNNISNLQTEADNYKSQLEQRDKDLKALKKSAEGNEDLQKQYDDLQKQYKTDTENLRSELQQNKLDSKLELKLAESGARNTKAVKALLDLDKITLDDKTEDLLGFDEQIKAVETDNAYLFDKGTSTRGYTPKDGDVPPTQPGTMEESIAQTINQ